MTPDSNFKKAIELLVLSVDTFDPYQHNSLHQSSKEFIAWCEANLSHEGARLLTAFINSIPFGFCDIGRMLEYLRKEYDLHE